MNAAIIISIAFAGLAGSIAGFGKHWKTACLISCLAVPVISAAVFAAMLEPPPLSDKGAWESFTYKGGWGVLTLFYALVCAFAVWGFCAGTNHGIRKLYLRSGRNVPEHRKVGALTFACRLICGALLAVPSLYWALSAGKADAYLLLLLTLLAPVAGLVLFANSIFCLARYRSCGQISVSLVFILVSVIGVFATFYFSPGFKM